jgi:DNA-binding protein YbaB
MNMMKQAQELQAKAAKLQADLATHRLLCPFIQF